MAKQKTVVPFKGTPEQEMKLRKIIAEYKDTEGALMPVLQKAQDLYGYLPIEVQTIIAEGLGLSIEHRVAICLGTACYVKGAQGVLDELEKELGIKAGGTTPDGMFTLEATRCLGCCGLAPVIMVDDDVHGRMTPKDVKTILAQYN